MKLVITVNAIIPRMSSIIAAPKMDVPIFPFNFPISRSVSTVMLTDVAVKTMPTKALSKKIMVSGLSPWKNRKYVKNPLPRGIKTPTKAMITADFPVAFRS